jgi:hypothetical protein
MLLPVAEGVAKSYFLLAEEVVNNGCYLLREWRSFAVTLVEDVL